MKHLARIFLAAVCAVAIPAHGQDNCKPVVFPKGQTITTLQGNAPAMGPVCYTFDAAAGRTARLKVTGTNMAMSVVDVGDDREEFNFPTQAQTYKFLVFQQMRSASPQRYTVMMELK
jgi:hypothetical protein